MTIDRLILLGLLLLSWKMYVELAERRPYLPVYDCPICIEKLP